MVMDLVLEIVLHVDFQEPMREKYTANLLKHKYLQMFEAIPIFCNSSPRF